MPFVNEIVKSMSIYTVNYRSEILSGKNYEDRHLIVGCIFHGTIISFDNFAEAEEWIKENGKQTIKDVTEITKKQRKYNHPLVLYISEHPLKEKKISVHSNMIKPTPEILSGESKSYYFSKEAFQMLINEHSKLFIEFGERNDWIPNIVRFNKDGTTYKGIDEPTLRFFIKTKQNDCSRNYTIELKQIIEKDAYASFNKFHKSV